MKRSRYDDMDEWEEEDLSHNAKSHKNQRDKARARRRIDEYNERKQLERYIDEDYN